MLPADKYPSILFSQIFFKLRCELRWDISGWSHNQFLTPGPAGLNLSATQSFGGFTRHVCQNLKFWTGNQNMNKISMKHVQKQQSSFMTREQAKKYD